MFKLFRSNRGKVLSARGIYQSERDRLVSVPIDIQQEETERIRDSLSRLQNKGLITQVGGESFRLSDAGESTYSEDLIWESQRHDHEELAEKHKKWQMWRRISFSMMPLGLIFLLLGGSLLFLSGGRYVEFWVGVSLLLVWLVLWLVVGPVLDRWASKLRLPSEDRVFIRLWEAYEFLSKYEHKKKEEHLKECIAKLRSVSKFLRARQFSSSWSTVEERIYPAFRKLGDLLNSKAIPLIEQGKIRQVSSMIIDIASSLRERDISEVLNLTKDLEPSKISAPRRWFLFLGELRTRRRTLALTLVLVFSLIISAGFWIISFLANRPVLSYAETAFGLWFGTMILIFLEVYLRDWLSEVRQAS